MAAKDLLGLYGSLKTEIGECGLHDRRKQSHKAVSPASHIDGHALVVAAERLGFAEVPIARVSHLSPEVIRACRIALNKLAEGAAWDNEALQFELIEIAPALLASDIEIEVLGFSTAEFDLMLSQPEPIVEDEVVPPTEKLAISSLGDLWEMDAHRLLCGNALSAEDFVCQDRSRRRPGPCSHPPIWWPQA